jgi:plastocyanin
MTTTWFRSLTCSAVAAVALALTAPAMADQSTGGTDDKGGSISGVVKFEGEKKERKALEMTTDPYCVKQHKEPVLSERWIFGKDDGLANVLVQVVKGPGVDGKKFTAPAKAHVVDQVGCMYTPHVSAIVLGQKVEFKNSDATLHNVHVMPKINKEENIGQPAKNMVTAVNFTKLEDAIFTKCDVHAWMNCYVHVLPHPYFAVTDKDGKFTIKGLPAGEYELKVWHEVKAFQAKEATIKATVKDGEAATANIVVSPKTAG